MGIADGMLLVVLAFFGALFYCLRQQDRRDSDRRKEDLPHDVERRQGERRKQGLLATLARACPWIRPKRSE